jgi:hypothetical protein
LPGSALRAFCFVKASQFFCHSSIFVIPVFLWHRFSKAPSKTQPVPDQLRSQDCCEIVNKPFALWWALLRAGHVFDLGKILPIG